MSVESNFSIYFVYNVMNAVAICLVFLAQFSLLV